jgi:hypothetical protein
VLLQCSIALQRAVLAQSLPFVQPWLDDVRASEQKTRWQYPEVRVFAVKTASRPSAPQPALASTLHDPDATTLPFLARADVREALQRYRRVTVAATPVTDPRVMDRLISLGVHVVPGGETGVGRRAALAAAMPHAAYFSCDFDRWLHWVMSWPEELGALPERVARMGSTVRSRPYAIVLGRTARAFATHPLVQRLPETSTNHALSLAAGRRLDAVSGAVWLSPEGAATVLGNSIEPSAATDLEWAALILRRDPTRLRGLRLEGLEWETPDFHAAAIAAAGGLDAWIASTFDTPAMWAARLRLAADSVAALNRVIGDGY